VGQRGTKGILSTIAFMNINYTFLLDDSFKLPSSPAGTYLRITC
jgi:hypothetical protein